ncbi:MAG: T6SS phospholipase effector Tle1-like catalytic domain-containing protein, partial [Limnohabitans sp.]
ELNVAFLGIFDTVASVGNANVLDNGVLAGHAGWADNSLEIHPAIRRCVHFVAAHEVRACFPLDSVRVKSQYPTNALEVMYPGVHSDVGGGYAPGDVGIGPRLADNLSIIPGRDMYEAARNAAVPLPLFSELKKTNPDLHNSLLPSKELITAYNNYLKASKVAPGPVEQMHRQHMAVYHSYRYKWRQVFTTRAMAFKHARKPREQEDLRLVQERFIRAMAMGQANPYTSKESPPALAQRMEAMHKAAGLQTSATEKRMAEVARSIDTFLVTEAVDYLFDWFVHDSVAGFKNQLDEFAANQLGAAKFRTVFKGDD